LIGLQCFYRYFVIWDVLLGNFPHAATQLAIFPHSIYTELVCMINMYSTISTFCLISIHNTFDQLEGLFGISSVDTGDGKMHVAEKEVTARDWFYVDLG
jgi:hypothetical protein